MLFGLQQDYEEFLASVGVPADPLWFTHEIPEKVSPPGIYVVRDGRDAVASMLHFVVTPQFRARYPDYKRTRVEELLSLPGFYERRINHWKEHVRSYLNDERSWHLVRYEELSGGKKRDVVEELASWIGADLTEAVLQEVMEKTTIESSHARAPGHVHKGKSGGFEAVLDDDHLGVFYEIAGEELDALGYER